MIHPATHERLHCVHSCPVDPGEFTELEDPFSLKAFSGLTLE